MESPSMYPTAADYANSNAQDAQSRIAKLERKLEQQIDSLLKRIQVLEHTIRTNGRD